MTIEEKYNKVRAALVGIIGCNDDKGELLAMLGAVHKMDTDTADDVENMKVTTQALVALIETA